jgi:hypothetical protein
MNADKSGLELPEAELARYLEAQVPGFRGPLVATKFKGGQSNPTYLIEAASGRYVLRRKPPGPLLPSAHAVDREFRVLQALHGGAVPVAQPLHLCTDESVIGSVFYLMQYVEGRVFWDPSLPELDPPARAATYEAIMATLAALHRVDVAAVGLADYGKPGNYFARQIHRWSEQYRASETGPLPDMDALMAVLAERCPAEDGSVALVHGDFRIDNLMFHPSGGGLGAEHAGPPAGRPGLLLHGAAAAAQPGAAGPGRPGPRGAGHPGGGGAAGALFRTQRAAHPGRLALRAGLQLLPPGGHRPGRGQTRPAGQCLERTGQPGRAHDRHAGRAGLEPRQVLNRPAWHKGRAGQPPGTLSGARHESERRYA